MNEQVRVIVTVRVEVETIDPRMGPVLKRGFQAGRYRYLDQRQTTPAQLIAELAQEAGTVAFARVDAHGCAD